MTELPKQLPTIPTFEAGMSRRAVTAAIATLGAAISPSRANALDNASIPQGAPNQGVLAALAASGGSALVSFQQAGTGAVARTSQAKMRDIVSVKDFGAIGDGVADDTAAIQAALNTGKSVDLGVGSFRTTATLRFTADGQILRGEGKGYFNEPARTKILYDGATNGKIVSVSDGVSEHWQSITLRDIYLDANGKALIGVEGYDSTITGGAWRNSYINLTIGGFTLPNSIGITFGTGSFPSFAHDAIIHGCFIINAAKGVTGAGAIYQFFSTTFLGCTNAIVATAGSAWAFDGCVFSSSTEYDFKGANIKLANFNGCWFENSGLGIYQASIAHCANFSGCFLQTLTANTTQLMDMGNAAGNFSVKGGSLGATSGSGLIRNINATAEYDITTSNITAQSGYRSRTSGYVRADNGAFAAGLAGDIANVTGDGTNYVVNTLAWTEDYDLGSAFNAANGIYTAPLDGIYQFTGQLNLNTVAAAHNDALLFLNVGGQLYSMAHFHAGNARIAGDELGITGTKTISVLAGQTAFLQIQVGGSTKTVGLSSGSAGTAWRTRFEGRMI